MGAGIWFYCKYCRGGRIIAQRNNQASDNSNEMIIEQKAITYNEEIE